MRQIPGITALRGLAAALVLVSHVAFWSGADALDAAGPLLARGDVGVAVFFAISAFLLVRPALDPAAVWPRPDYGRHRAARILPAYWVTLAAVLVVAATLGEGVGGPLRVLDHLVLIQGYTGETYRGFTQTWSLTTEVTFYALVPLIGVGVRRLAAAGRSPLPMLAVIAGVGIAAQAWSASRTDPAYGPLTSSVAGHAAWFAVGVALAWSHRTEAASTRACAVVSPARALGTAATLLVLVATPLGGPVDLSHPSAWAAGTKEALYAAIAGCLLHAVCGPLGSTGSAVVASGPAQLLGELSYGVFCWHVLVLEVLFEALDLPLFHTSFVLVLVPTAAISLALARWSWRFVERPAIRRAHRRRPA